ncbi:MAG: SDR family oxidoreductase [Chitinophagales bacterium]
MPTIFITGGTGYMGSRLIRLLLDRNFQVRALVRKGSEGKVPAGAVPVIGDAFSASSFTHEIPRGAIFVQLLGVAHPGPKKKVLFRKIDLASALASVQAAREAQVSHFVYISVAQTPTKIMEDYQRCRAEAESAIISSGLSATFIRPWYVVGPGHFWPLFLQPLFKILEWIPSNAKKAKALRLVYLKQMLRVMVHVIENPPKEIRIIEIEEIRRF